MVISEFNHNNGFIGQMVTINDVLLGTTAREQFATPVRSALEEVITKEYMIDHQNSLHQSFALTSCDLARCYDISIYIAAALVLIIIGIPHHRIKSMFKVIQQMIHRIKIVFRVSDITYG